MSKDKSQQPDRPNPYGRPVNSGNVGAGFSSSAQSGYGGNQTRAGAAPADMTGYSNPAAPAGGPVSGNMPSSGGSMNDLFGSSSTAPPPGSQSPLGDPTSTSYGVQLYGPTAALFGVSNGGTYYGHDPDTGAPISGSNGTRSSSNPVASPYAAGTNGGLIGAAHGAAVTANASGVPAYTPLGSNNHASSPLGNIPMPNTGSPQASPFATGSNGGLMGAAQHAAGAVDTSGVPTYTPMGSNNHAATPLGNLPGTGTTSASPFAATTGGATSASPFARNGNVGYSSLGGSSTQGQANFGPSPTANFGPPSGSGQTQSGPAVGGQSNQGAYANSTIAGGTAPPPAIPYGSVQNQLDTSKVPNLVGGDALRQAMLQQQQAAYQQAVAYLDPQWANAQRDLETRLANQGIPVGSDAYTRAMSEFQRSKAFAYSQAEQAAVQQGNTAQAQLFGQGLAANQNAFGQALSGGQFSNSAEDQIARQILANLGFNEGVAQNNFNNSMTVRNQDINELLLKQQNPLQMYLALTQGSGITPPNFTSTPGASINPTDIAGIINAALGQQNNVYNAQVGAQNSNTAAYATIIAALLSDRRFKKNVRMIGMHEVGVPLYTFDYVWGEPGIGVMADELQKVKPRAVIELSNGMLAVNYAELSEVA